MSLKYIGKHVDQDDLPKITDAHYENIFNMFELISDGNQFKIYNILTNVKLPELNDDIYLNVTIPSHLPWTAISHRIYGTQHLWWMIVLANNIQDPTSPPAIGSNLRYIRTEFIDDIVEQIKSQF